MDGKDIILDILLQQDRAHYNLEKTKIQFRCPYCLDSKSDRNVTSFNVSLPTEDNPNWLYICFRSECRASGRINPEFLRMLGSDNHQANVYLNKVNRLSKKEKRFRGKHKRELENFPSPVNKLTLAKLEYLNKRLGTSLSPADLLKLKIHLDFENLYKYNDLVFPEKRAWYYKKLSQTGIAFISAYNEYLTVRNTVAKSKSDRYTVVDVWEGDNSEKHKFYVIPTKIDVLSPDPTVINMSEGSIDILSVFLNLDIGKEYDNRIYAAVSGSTYERALTHLIRQHGLTDIIVHIYSDDNINIEYFEELARRVSQYTNSMRLYVHYNTKSDDFGVPREMIEIETTRIK